MSPGDMVRGGSPPQETGRPDASKPSYGGAPVWTTFAGTMLVFAGTMRSLDALWAFGYRGKVPSGLKDAILGEELGNYGWWWLVTGLILLGAGLAVLSGSENGRWAGIAAAGVCGLGAMTWMPYYPMWSLVYVLFAVVTIAALIVGAEREQ